MDIDELNAINGIEITHAEFESEWNQLQEVLRECGGLESAIRRSQAALDLQPPAVTVEKLGRARASRGLHSDKN